MSVGSNFCARHHRYITLSFLFYFKICRIQQRQCHDNQKVLGHLQSISNCHKITMPAVEPTCMSESCDKDRLGNTCRKSLTRLGLEPRTSTSPIVALTTEPSGCGIVPAYYPCGRFSMVTDTTQLGTGCDCMSTLSGHGRICKYRCGHSDRSVPVTYCLLAQRACSKLILNPHINHHGNLYCIY